MITAPVPWSLAWCEDGELAAQDRFDLLQSLVACESAVGLPRLSGQVNRRHAMTLRLSIDDQSNQDQAPVHGAAKAGGC